MPFTFNFTPLSLRGGLIVAAVEGRAELALLSTASSSATLSLQDWVPFTGGGQPTSVAFNSAGTRIWATGVSAGGEGEGDEKKRSSVIFVADVVQDVEGGKPPPAAAAAAALAIDAPPSAKGGGRLYYNLLYSHHVFIAIRAFGSSVFIVPSPGGKKKKNTRTVSTSCWA